MEQGTLTRRNVVASGAVVGGLAFVAGPPRARAAAVAGPAQLQARGVVALWTTLDPDGGARFRLVQLDGKLRPQHELAAGAVPASRVTSVAQLQTLARGFAVGAAARSWGVAMAACCIDARSIWHPPSGHQVRYLGWTDII